jgi:crossover junction endodeoxyribonuclease RusA
MDAASAQVSVTFRPPDKRRRDLDNLVASAKSLGDGVADAIRVDDALWSVTYAIGEPTKGGAVIVEIEGIS